jgi:CRP/FNR family cyclic AMP-dependent transcriptional regulator
MEQTNKKQPDPQQTAGLPDENQTIWSMVPVVAALPSRVQQAMARHSVRRTYREQETIFLEGDPVAGWFLVESGVVKISRFSKDGREHIIHFLRDGATFNDVAVLDGGPNPVTAIAQADAILHVISRRDLQRLAQEFPELGWALAGSIARRARFLVNQVQDLSMRNVRGRLACLLLEEAARENETAVPRMLTQDDMAARLGTVRDVVGRALRGLAADGIITFDRHQIVILDTDQLSEEADV